MSYENEMQQLHDDYHVGRISTEEFSGRRVAILSKYDKNNSQQIRPHKRRLDAEEGREQADKDEGERISTPRFVDKWNRILTEEDLHNKNNSQQTSNGMVICSVCQKEISPRARVCPHCGEKRDNYERTSSENLAGLLILIAIIVIPLLILFTKSPFGFIISIVKLFAW